jgi:hypothetical protein
VKIPQPTQLLPLQAPGVLSVHWSVHSGKIVKSLIHGRQTLTQLTSAVTNWALPLELTFTPL